MTQTIALLIDAYRELNARKMFWISLIISGVVMVAFALLGISDNGLKLLGLNLPMPVPQFWYKYLFSTLIIGLWVSVGAMILALISTASIFPDLLAGGSIDLYLSKPISRLRLFLTKYFGGLLFVLLQATVFTVASYLVFGLRGGQWRTTLLLIIPLTTLLFSYLFAVCVLVGVVTRSTIAAILVTCLFWLLSFAASYTEQGMFAYRSMQFAESRALERQARLLDAEIDAGRKSGSIVNAFGFRESLLRGRQEALQRRADEAAASGHSLDTAYRVVRGIATIVPKTGETINLLDRKLFSDEDLQQMRDEMADSGGMGGRQRRRPPPPLPPPNVSTTSPTTGPADQAVASAELARQVEQRRAAQMEAQEEADRLTRSRSISWVLGTSIAFEVVVLSIAAWVFCRRDY